MAESTYQHRVLKSLASAQNYIAWLASLARPTSGTIRSKSVRARDTMQPPGSGAEGSSGSR